MNPWRNCGQNHFKSSWSKSLHLFRWDFLKEFLNSPVQAGLVDEKLQPRNLLGVRSSSITRDLTTVLYLSVSLYAFLTLNTQCTVRFTVCWTNRTEEQICLTASRIQSFESRLISQDRMSSLYLCCKLAAGLSGILPHGTPNNYRFPAVFRSTCGTGLDFSQPRPNFCC